MATELKVRGVSSNNIDFDITKGADGGLGSLVVGSNNNDPLVQLQIADAAIKVLKDQGVDTTNIKGFDPGTNPLAWNVVYKDGGWIING